MNPLARTSFETAQRACARALWPALLVSLLLPPVGCETEPTDGDRVDLPLEAACVPADAPPPTGAWVCGEAWTEECGAAVGSHPGTIWVVPSAGGAAPELLCVDDALAVSDEGPFGPGEHAVVVWIDANGAERLVCESVLTVRDTTAPRVTTRDVALWPPNHRMEVVAPGDCLTVEDRCDADVDLIFTWASSDEPADATGDGSTAPDIQLGPDAVSLRAERQGGGDGRVYTIGWLAVDDAGNAVDGTCRVAVPHDQGGGAQAVDSGPDRVVGLDGPVPAGPYEVRVRVTGDDAEVTLDRPE